MVKREYFIFSALLTKKIASSTCDDPHSYTYIVITIIISKSEFLNN